METILFIKWEDILDYTTISGNIDPNKLTPHIYNAQILYLEPILGSDLYNKIEYLIRTDDINISQYSNYLSLKEDYIKPSIVFHTLELVIPLNAYEISDGGVSQHIFSNAQYSPLTEIEKITKKYSVIGSKYDDKLVKYLCKNSTLFPEYQNNTGLIGKTETTNRTSGIYLGVRNAGSKIRR